MFQRSVYSAVYSFHVFFGSTVDILFAIALSGIFRTLFYSIKFIMIILIIIIIITLKKTRNMHRKSGAYTPRTACRPCPHEVSHVGCNDRYTSRPTWYVWVRTVVTVACSSFNYMRNLSKMAFTRKFFFLGQRCPYNILVGRQTAVTNSDRHSCLHCHGHVKIESKANIGFKYKRPLYYW